MIEPTAIFMSMENMEIKIDESVQLSYILMPDNASDYGITWKSANPSIATVDENGNVTAVSDGITTIICSAANGQIASCSVTVLPPSAIEQLNEREKKLFDYMVKTWLSSFYNAPAVRIRNLYWGGGNSESVLSVIADIQGMNRLGGYTYKYYGIILTEKGCLALVQVPPYTTQASRGWIECAIHDLSQCLHRQSGHRKDDRGTDSRKDICGNGRCSVG